MAIIYAKNLTKIFRVAEKKPGFSGAVRHLLHGQYVDKIAVDSIDLIVEEGESVAYVGPNGAGKSTTLKMLTGILVPTSGIVEVCGIVPHERRIANARRIGVVFGQRTQLWWDLPVAESLRLLGDIYNVSESNFKRNLTEMVELLDLSPLLAVPVRQLSLGQRMRCELVAALLHSPQILFLDEPTIGLDVSVKAKMREYIRHASYTNGVTLLLTSHDLSDIETLCNRIIMIDRARIVFDGPFSDIRGKFGKERTIILSLSAEVEEASTVVRNGLGNMAARVLPMKQRGADDPLTMHIEFDSSLVSSPDLVSRLLSILPVRDLRIEEPSAEQIVRRLYEGQLE